MPDWAREVRTRLSSLQLSPTRERESIEELTQHLDDRWRELMAGGASPDEATRLALADFTDGDFLAKHIAVLRQAHAPSSVTPGAATGHSCAPKDHPGFLRPAEVQTLASRYRRPSSGIGSRWCAPTNRSPSV
jgi:hypothetical protein